MSTTRLTIFDTTLRDGEQAPGFSLRIDEKLKLAHQLAALGVDIIEAGFPIASEADAEAVRMVATHVRGPVIARACALHGRRHRARGVGARSRRRGVASTSSSPPPTCTSSASCASRAKPCLDAAVAAIHRARRYTDDVQFSAEDATRSDMDFLCRVVEAVI